MNKEKNKLGILTILWMTFVTILPILLAAIFYHLYKTNIKTFINICNEDNLVENLQFAFFFVAALGGILLSIRFWRAKDMGNALPYTLFALLCLFIAMEEISWGQRIFDIETPESMKSENIQDEINLHNLESVQDKVFLFYCMVGGGACATAALWVIPFLRRKRWFHFYSVHPTLIFYFLPVFIYGAYRLKLGSWAQMRTHLSHKEARMISIIQEPIELGLAIGFLLIILMTWRQSRKWNK
ncbi:MAG: hypothetical protein KAH23_04740 [Kiritimatiellae bacterium]|nr:hypothetical protein [Kiritimatiellia bacterium]